MHNERWLTLLGRGLFIKGGLPIEGESACPMALWEGRPPPVDRMIDTCGNFTLSPAPSFATGKNMQTLKPNVAG